MNLFYFSNLPSLSGKLKPMICQSCKDDGVMDMGNCPKCLENQAWNKEYLETHTFITDTYLGCYHDSGHDQIKSLKLRMPNEHPYLYYGIELEIEFEGVNVTETEYNEYDEEEDSYTSSYIEETLEKCSEIMDGMCVYERDGSLDNGVEFIFRPCSYAYLTDKNTIEKFKKLFEYLKDRGAMVNQPSGNGMHIHLSRKFFDYANTELQDKYEAYQNFNWLFQFFQNEVELLGGRRYTEYCTGDVEKAKRRIRNMTCYDSELNLEAEIKCKLKKGGSVSSGDHNSSVTVSGPTIEARVFKSTTDYKQMMANIEIVRNFAHAAREKDVQKSLNEILHTKDNMFLDEHIQKTKMKAKKNKDEFNIDKVNTNEIEIIVD